MFRYALAGVLMLSTVAAMADGPSYSYIQATYAEVELDAGGPFNVDGDGFGVAGSVAVGDSWYIFADYTTAELESVLDLDLTTAGAGYHHAMSDKTDLFAELGFAKIDVQFVGDDSGIAARVGVRSMVSESLELTASVGTLEFDDVDYGTEFGAGLWYTVSGNFAIGADARFADEVSRYGLGIRLFFD